MAARTWKEFAGLRGHESGPKWQPGAGGMCLHSIVLDQKNPERMFIAISAAGAFRTDDGGKDMEADQSRFAFAIHSRSERGGRALRASYRDASIAAEHALHAETLGHHAQRRRGRFMARGEREFADRFRFPDRHSCARAGDDLRRADQERLGAFSARRQAARLSQPDRRQRMGRADERPAANAIAT